MLNTRKLVPLKASIGTVSSYHRSADCSLFAVMVFCQTLLTKCVVIIY